MTEPYVDQPSSAPIQSDESLLCERCGYVLEGLPVEGKCPECGQAIAETIAQRPLLPSVGLWPVWWSRSVSVIRNPKDFFTHLAIDTGWSRRVFMINISAAAALPPLATLGMVVIDPVSRTNHFGTAFFLMVPAPFVWVLLFVLTTIERIGLGFWARKRGWRITGAVPHVITHYASVGWLIGSLITSLGLAGALFYVREGFDIVPRMPAWIGNLAGGTIIAGLIVGLLTFEILVYIGVRQCKFANTPQRTAQASRL